MPGCNNVNESDDDVWFIFTAQDTAQFLHLRAMHDNAVLRVELFEGDCASPQSLFCSDPFNAFSDKVRLSGLTPGNAYLFRVYTTIGGYAFLRLALTNTLQNDACAGALELTSATLEAFNTLPLVDGLSATDGTGSCATTRDIWYRFTATGGSATFLAPQEAVTNVELLTGTCGAHQCGLSEQRSARRLQWAGLRAAVLPALFRTRCDPHSPDALPYAPER